MQRRSFLTGASALCLAGPARAAGDGAHGVWRARADMPFAVQEIYPALYKGPDGEPIIVNAGGLSPRLGDPVRRATVVYDPATDKWLRGVDLPATRHHLALAAVDAPTPALHAIGGFTREGLDLRAMQTQNWRTVDIVNGSWAAARPLPAPQAEAVTLSHGGRIHMIGGRTPAGDANKSWSDQTDTGAHRVYDPADDAWSTAAPLPFARNSAAGAVLDGALYVISGRTVAAGNTPDCHAYDPDADRWREIAPLPAPIRQRAPRGQGGLAAAALGGRVYAFGGEWFDGDGGVYADAWEYDPAADAWRAVAAMTRPRHGLGAVAHDGAVYVIGGASERGGRATTGYTDRFEI